MSDTRASEYTTPQAAAQLHISVRTLQRARAAGEIGYVKDGSSVRYTHDHLMAFERFRAARDCSE